MYQLPEIPVKKKPRPAYKKPEALKALEALYMADHRQRYPNMPEYARTCKKYRDDSSNSLTKSIIDFLNMSGHLAERINTCGRYVDQSQTFTDVLGKTRTIGTGQWLPTSGIRGSADISATINGRSVKIEVKQKDKQSEDQKRYQQRIEAAGGIYLIVRNFTEFYEWYNANYAVATEPQKYNQCIDNQYNKNESDQ